MIGDDFKVVAEMAAEWHTTSTPIRCAATKLIGSIADSHDS
jgi:hypothetical protein